MCPSFRVHRFSNFIASPPTRQRCILRKYIKISRFSRSKKKKKRKHGQKCRTHLAPEIGIPVSHRFIYTTIDIKKLIQPGQIILDLRIKGSEIPGKLANRRKHAKKKETRMDWTTSERLDLRLR